MSRPAIHRHPVRRRQQNAVIEDTLRMPHHSGPTFAETIGRHYTRKHRPAPDAS
jgi:hypothetical protein